MKHKTLAEQFHTIRDAQCCQTCRYCLCIVPAGEMDAKSYCRKKVRESALGGYIAGRGRGTLPRWVCDFWEMKK